MSKRILTIERLNDLLTYAPETGIFRWRVKRSAGVKAGDVAGGVNGCGYVQISIDGKLYTAHRLALMTVSGEWPSEPEIDHRNGDRTDNRISNLRPGTKSDNQQNIRAAKSNSKTGLLGVSTVPRGFVANINVDGAKRYLGFFQTPEAAHGAYLTAKRQLHGSCTI